MREREVGTLWIGGALSWLEQLCLKSFVDQGQKITLFSFQDIPNVPEGVIRRDGREVLDTGNFIKYERKDSFALFADQFRVLMLRAFPGMIWVDTDIYCLRPMTYDSDVVMGFELPDSLRVNNAVLGLPPNHPMLADMIDFMSDPFAIPPFVKPQLQADYRAAAARGAPVHVSQQPWGTWGPLMLTWFASQHAMHRRIMPMAAFYPIPFPDRLTFLKRRATVEALLTPETTALHLWASNKREIGLRHEGLPPPGSYLDHLVRKHGIRPEAAPIKGRGKRLFDAGLIEHVDLEKVGRVADIGGNAQSFVLAAQAKWGAKVDLVDVDHKGRFCPEPSPWVAPYTAFLTDHGVPAGAIRRIGRAEEAVAADLVANLIGFGDLNKIGPLPGLLDLILAPGGRLLTDIRKGSGGFPVLKPRGTILPVLERDDQGVPIARVILAARPAARTSRPARKGAGPTPPPAAPPPAAPPPPRPATPSPAPAPQAADEPWSDLARRLAGPEGFVREGAEHSFLFVPRGKTLVVTFDNLDIAMEKREDRRPWGYSFIEKQGWSMLGVMANGWTWFRDPWVHAQFDDLADSGFFARFDRVVFYGASMGGYGAAAFVPACPGADVVAISPQSTLARDLVPWETRYSTAWGRDFGGPYGDAAAVSAAAGRVILLYDPYEPLDSQHVARFTGTNVMKLRAPLMGHRLGSSLQQMGILSTVTLSALDGTLTEAAFYTALRARKSFPRYQRELFKRALDRGHETLARRMGRWVLTRGDNRAIRKALADL